MEVYQNDPVLATCADQVGTLLQAWSEDKPCSRNFGDFEKKVREATMNLERAILEKGLALLDIDCQQVQVGDRQFNRLDQKRRATYYCLAGKISLERFLYKPEGSGRPICPLELRAGIVEGSWTPCAAEIMLRSVALMSPYEAERLLPKFGGFRPSRSSLDRLPKAVSKRWEESRTEWETAIRDTEVVPTAAGTVVLSLDGVTVPMKDGKRAEKREEARNRGKQTRGPAGYREASCGVVSIYNDHEERLQTAYYARMPESKKVTLHEQLLAETSALLSTLPCPIFVLTSDGAPDNWRILDGILHSLQKQGSVRPDDVIYRIADFYHASEHLKRATDLFYGQNSPQSYGTHETLRRCLRDEDNGVDFVIKKLTYFRNNSSGSARQQLNTKLEYFRSRSDQMRYAEFQSLGLPIGTGVTEAACKTLVTQRLKRSGMRWENSGGQAVLTLRSLLQSDRWEKGWELLSASYCPPVIKVTQRQHLRVLEPLKKAS
jgi:hypothetical protein